MRELVLKVFICWFWFENTVYKRRKRKKRKKNNVMKWGGRGSGAVLGWAVSLHYYALDAHLSCLPFCPQRTPHLIYLQVHSLLVPWWTFLWERERERESFYLSTSKQPLDWLFLLVKIFLPYWNCKPLFRIILILFLFYVIFRDKISLPRYATWTYLMCCNHVFVFCHFL